jgi:hypothetical protein
MPNVTRRSGNTLWGEMSRVLLVCHVNKAALETAHRRATPTVDTMPCVNLRWVEPNVGSR